MPAIASVTGPVDSADLGYVLAHEHVSAASPGIIRSWPALHGGREALVDRGVRALRDAKAAGVDTIVDCTTFDLGRDPELLVEVSERSGVTIIASTGCWLDPSATMRARSVDQLADWFRSDLTQGVDGTDVRAGVIKLASDERVEPYAAMVLEAAARVSIETGAPIITHTAAAHRTGEAQAELLESHGVDPARVAIGHSDDSDDIGYLAGLAARGYRIAMDRLPNGALPNYGGQDVEARIEMIAAAGRAWLRRPCPARPRRPHLGRPAGRRGPGAAPGLQPRAAHLRLRRRPARPGAAGGRRGGHPRPDRRQPPPVAGRFMTVPPDGQRISRPQDVHSIPLDNPLHGPPPARFRDGEVLVIQYRTDAEAVAAVVPEPLVVTGDTVMVQVARWGDVPGLGRDTHEVNVMVPVRYDGPDGPVGGAYSPYFFVDSDRAMAGGREFHGQPKRMAEVALETRGDLIVGSLRRNGIDVFTGTLPYKSRVSSVEEVRQRVDFVTNINLKVIPQIDGRPGIRQLTARDLVGIDLAECWSGTGTARVEPNPQAPLYRLPVREHLDGFYWRGEFSLVGGVVLHEYAAGSARG